MEPLNEPMQFDGPDYNPDLDQARLTGQIKRIFDFMKVREWRTLTEISIGTGDPEASVSAQLRHLRKERFGSHVVDKRRRGNKKTGLWEYMLIPNVSHVQKTLFDVDDQIEARRERDTLYRDFDRYGNDAL